MTMDDQERYESLTKVIEISSSAAHINNRLLQIAHFLCLRGLAPTITFYLLQHRDRQLTLRLAADSGGSLRLPTPPYSYVLPTDDSLCRPIATHIANPLDPTALHEDDLFRKKRPYGWSLPLADEAQVYGTMVLLHHEPFPVTTETIQFLLVVCRQIASCLRGDILRKRAHRKVTRLKFLHRIGAQLNASENIQNVFSQLPDSSPTFFAHTASILTTFATNNAKPQTFDQGFKEQTQRDTGLKLSRQLTTQAKFTPHPTVVDQNSPPTPLYEQFFKHFSAHITLPLISRGVMLGTLEFFLDRNPKSQKLLPLEKPDLELLEILAVHIAATLERTRTQVQLNAANQASLLRTMQLTISHRMKNALLAADSPEKIIRLTLGALVSNEGFSCSPAIYLEYLEKEKFWCTRFYARTPQSVANANRYNIADDNTPLETLTDHLLSASINLPAQIETEMAKLKLADLEMAPSRFRNTLQEQKTAIIAARFVTTLHPTLAKLIPGSEIIVIPIPGKEHLKGVILADAGRIKQQDLSYITLFTDAAALALDNTELYQLLQNSLATLNSAQTRLTQSEKLVALGEMATSIAHEIKNPLVSIGGFARRLHKQIPADCREKNYSLVITKEIERLEEIVNNVLSFSRTETNKFTLQNINQLIKETTALFARELKKLEIELKLQLDPEIPPVECDGNQIKQVLINLINNSMHAITDSNNQNRGHHIIIRTITFCNLDKREERALIEIEDNGSGIPEQVLHDIFNPFFTTKHDGTGLGLPICHRIILNHQGEIRIHNRVDRGVKVAISLPFKHKVQPEPSV
jgi:signal transduction histidine kinase/GAF domain-containing protein